jgi:hypothetical protein
VTCPSLSFRFSLFTEARNDLLAVKLQNAEKQLTDCGAVYQARIEDLKTALAAASIEKQQAIESAVLRKELEIEKARRADVMQSQFELGQAAARSQLMAENHKSSHQLQDNTIRFQQSQVIKCLDQCCTRLLCHLPHPDRGQL